jgi:hypothetical protein
MSHTYETRSIASNLKDPAGVARVACIGDSMMFGFGGPSRHSFPAHLGRILNAAYPRNLVFVDNFGQTAGNVWNSWPLFKARADAMRFDAVVFSICQNDMELFNDSGAIYGADKRRHSFDQGTPTRAAGIDLLRDVACWQRATSIDLLVMFYSFHRNDRPVVDKAKAMCSEAGVAMIDMLEFFQQETGMTVNTYRVSEFDGHPSNMAHEMAARRIAREMRARNFLARAPATADEGEAALVRAAESMTAQGVQADDALVWILEVAEGKMNAARRQSAASGANTASISWSTTGDLAKASLLQWRGDLRRRVRSREFESMSRKFESEYANFVVHRRNFEEMLFALTHLSPGSTPVELRSLFAPTAHRNYRDVPNSLRALFSPTAHRSFRNLPGALLALFTSRKKPVLGELPSFGDSVTEAAREARQQMDTLIERLGLNQESPAGAAGVLRAGGVLPLDYSVGLEGPLAFEVYAMDQQVQLLHREAQSLDASLSDNPALRDLVAILMISWREFFAYADRLTKQADNILKHSTPKGPPHTIVNVTVEGATRDKIKEQFFDLCITFVYDTPRRGIIRDRQNAGALKERATYHFEFPLMLKGTVIVGLPIRGVNRALFEFGKARFSSIEIGNANWDMQIDDAMCPIRWKNNGERTATIRFDDVILA